MLKLDHPDFGPTYWKEVTEKEYNEWLALVDSQYPAALAELEASDRPVGEPEEGTNDMGGVAHDVDAAAEAASTPSEEEDVDFAGAPQDGSDAPE